MPFDAMTQHLLKDATSIATPVVKPTVWTLEMALELVRAMQPFIKVMGYHAMIAGGVLLNGTSKRDLDLVFMPTGEVNRVVAKDIELLTWLGETLGKGTILQNKLTPPYVNTYKHYMQFKYDGLLIDVYIG